MKTAKEMFEELGLKYYETPFNDMFQYGEYITGMVNFDTTYRHFDTNKTVGVELFKAIHQQMKELGWIE